MSFLISFFSEVDWCSINEMLFGRAGSFGGSTVTGLDVMQLAHRQPGSGVKTRPQDEKCDDGGNALLLAWHFVAPWHDSRSK